MRREQLADLVGQLGVLPRVLLDRRALAAAVAAGEVVGQLGEQLAGRRRRRRRGRCRPGGVSASWPQLRQPAGHLRQDVLAAA